jgi:hypothetical protein
VIRRPIEGVGVAGEPLPPRVQCLAAIGNGHALRGAQMCGREEEGEHGGRRQLAVFRTARQASGRAHGIGAAPRAVIDRGARMTNRGQQRKAPPLEELFRIGWVQQSAASVRAEVVSDLRRATCVQHHGRTEPSATNAANASRPQYQRNLAVTSTANDGWKTFTRPGSLVRPSIGCTESPYIAEFPADHTRRASDTRQRMRRARGRS